jgi:hypothetical protein
MQSARVFLRRISHTCLLKRLLLTPRWLLTRKHTNILVRKNISPREKLIPLIIQEDLLTSKYDGKSFKVGLSPTYNTQLPNPLPHNTTATLRKPQKKNLTTITSPPQEVCSILFLQAVQCSIGAIFARIACMTTPQPVTGWQVFFIPRVCGVEVKLTTELSAEHMCTFVLFMYISHAIPTPCRLRWFTKYATAVFCSYALHLSS